MKAINIITELAMLPQTTSESVGLLLACAADSPTLKPYKNIFFIHDLLGDADETKKMACDLANQILQNEPKILGIPQLAVFKEILILRLTHIFKARHLYHFLLSQGYKLCRFYGYSECAKILSDLAEMHQSSLKIVFPKISIVNNKYLARAKIFFSSLFLGNAFLKNIDWLVNKIDFFHRRQIIFSFFKSKNHPVKNKLWFLSYGKNYTNIGLLYEPLFPEKFYFLIEDPLTGGEPLKQKNRDFFNLYDYGSNKLIPKKSDIISAKIKLQNYLDSLLFQDTQFVVMQLFLKDPWLQQFFDVHLPAGLYFTQLHKKWIALTEPKAIILGNNAFEAYAFFLAKEKGVNTILLQHGILGDYYQFVDTPVDFYIVRGEFWRRFLTASAQNRTIVLNFNTQKKLINQGVYHQSVNTKKFVVYFSSLYPGELKKMECIEDGDARLLSIAHAVSNSDAKLIIRLHPRDQIAMHKKYILNLYKKNKIKVDLQFSFKEPVPELLKGASAAIMYFSTVFMDCLILDIPIIGYDWLDFPLKKHIQLYPIFHFSKNLFELRTLIEKALKNELPKKKIDQTLFLSDETDFKARKILHELVCLKGEVSS